MDTSTELLCEYFSQLNNVQNSARHTGLASNYRYGESRE